MIILNDICLNINKMYNTGAVKKNMKKKQKWMFPIGPQQQFPVPADT